MPPKIVLLVAFTIGLLLWVIPGIPPPIKEVGKMIVEGTLWAVLFAIAFGHLL